uniref:Sialin-like n=1 Tax=Petromyzon marinus TaxID=7757 RepID=A0AAJ7T5B8_PETMA|nr:sialin-like [Petromyzon marinus]
MRVILAPGRTCSCRSRHILAALGFIGLALVYALRVNLSVAMVAMVNSTGAAHQDNSSAYCPQPVPLNGSHPAQLPSVAVYNWNSKIQGWILSSFFYGYIITQVPGGYLAVRYGGKLLFGMGVMVTTVLTLLTPLAADLGVPWIILVRVLEGIGEVRSHTAPGGSTRSPGGLAPSPVPTLYPWYEMSVEARDPRCPFRVRSARVPGALLDVEAPAQSGFHLLRTTSRERPGRDSARAGSEGAGLEPRGGRPGAARGPAWSREGAGLEPRGGRPGAARGPAWSREGAGLEPRGGRPGAARGPAWSREGAGLEPRGGRPGAARGAAWSREGGGLEPRGGRPGAARGAAWSREGGGLEPRGGRPGAARGAAWSREGGARPCLPSDGAGVTYPTMHAMWALWAPPYERSTLISICYSGKNTQPPPPPPLAPLPPPHSTFPSPLPRVPRPGGHFGTVVTMPLSGIIAETLGWASIFYIFGGMGLLWSFFWYFFAFSSPDSHPRISLAEREYIQTTLRAERQASPLPTICFPKTTSPTSSTPAHHTRPSRSFALRVRGAQVEKRFSSVPWLRMALSLPVWALNVAMFCSSWAFYTIFTSMPTFMSTVLHFNLQENGQLTALPYVAGWLCTLLGGWAADAILRQKLLSTTATRKSLTFLGLAAPGAFLVGAAFVGCDHVLAVCFLTFAVGTSSFATAGCWVNQLDIAPQYAAVLLGISNTISSLPGFLAPVATGYLTQHNTLMEWQVVFYISAAISLFGAFFYVAFGSGEQQSWAWEAGPEVGASPGVSFLTETSLTIKGLDPPVTS